MARSEPVQETKQFYWFKVGREEKTITAQVHNTQHKFKAQSDEKKTKSMALGRLSLCCKQTFTKHLYLDGSIQVPR